MESEAISLKNHKEEEYEVQLFGFSRREVTDGVKQIVSDQINTATEELHICIAKYIDKGMLPKLQLATDCLRQEYEAASIESRPRWENIIEEYLKIPHYVLLPEDAVQSTQYTKEDVQKLDEELKDLEKRAKRALFMKVCLEKEKAALKEVGAAESQFKNLQKELEPMFINDKVSKKVERLISATCETVVSESVILKKEKRQMTDYIDHVIKKRFSFPENRLQE